MQQLKPQSPKDSAVETRYLVMPSHANPQGTAFGGTILAWIDVVAAMAAQRHCGKEVVTAQIDSIIFKQPIRVGDQVCLKASVNYVGRTSMEVGVQVTREDPPVLPQTDAEKRRYENAKLRVQARKALLKNLT